VAVDAILGHDGDFDAFAPLVNGEGDVSLFRVKLPSDGRSGNFDVDFQFLLAGVRHEQVLLVAVILLVGRVAEVPGLGDDPSHIVHLETKAHHQSADVKDGNHHQMDVG